RASLGRLTAMTCVLSLVLPSFSSMLSGPPRSTLFPYTTLFRSLQVVRLRVRRNALEQELREVAVLALVAVERDVEQPEPQRGGAEDDQAQQRPRPEARPPAHRDSRGRCQRCRVSIDVKPARLIPRPAGSPIAGRAGPLVARGAPWIVMVSTSIPTTFSGRLRLPWAHGRSHHPDPRSCR